MSIADIPQPMGLKLQDALAAAIGDPVGDALADLDAGSLLTLLTTGHPINSVRAFMNDHKVPARHPDLLAAQRLLPRVRQDKGARRRKATRWLTSDLRTRVHDALVSAVGPADAKEQHSDIDVGDLIDAFGTTAVQLAVLSEWGSERCELDLAMLIVEGRAVPDRWQAHLDRLGPIARLIVDDFDEAHHGGDLALDGAMGDPADDDTDDDTSDNLDEQDLAGRQSDRLAERDPDDAEVTGPAPVGTSLAPEPPAPEAPIQAEPGHQPLPQQPMRDQSRRQEVAVTAASDRFELAQRDALAALDTLEAARHVFHEAVDVIRRLVAAGGPVRLAEALPSAPGAVKANEIEALRAYAAEALDTGDTEQVEFLSALAALADLAGAGAADDALMAAEDAVLAFPAAARFRGVVFAASRARLWIGPNCTVDERLHRWIHNTPESAVQGLGPTSGDSDGAASAGETGGVEIVGATPVQGRTVTTASSPANSSPSPESGMPTPDDVASVTVAAQGATSAAAASGADDEVGEQDMTGPSDAAATEIADQTVSAAAEAVYVPEIGAGPAPTGIAKPPVVPEPPLVSEAPAVRDLNDRQRLRVDAALARMLATGRWGLARWLARASGDNERADALEAVAYADGARAATGPLAVALTDTLDALSLRRLGGDRPAQLLATAAAARAALVAPFSGVTAALSQLARTFDTEAPAVAAVADAAVSAAVQGVAFTGDVVASLGGVAATDAKIVAIAADGEAMLRRTGRTGFTRADHIWSEWVATGGPIHDLLAAVVANDATRTAAVRAAVFEYSKDSVITQRLRASDDRHRGGGKPRVEGPARTTLLGRLRDAVKIAGTWVDLVEATSLVHTNDHEAAVAARVRATVRAQGHAVGAALDGWAAGPDVVLAGAAAGARRLYATTFALVEGEALGTEERSAADLLDVDLLRTSVAVNPDLTPVNADAVTVDAVIDADVRSWEDAFAARCANGDHVGTGAIVTTVAATDAVRGAELATRRAGALAEARGRVGRRAEALLGTLEAARRSGRLDEDSAVDLALRLATAAHDGRADIDVVDAELDEIDRAIEVAATEAVDAFRDRLAELRDVAAVAAATVRFAQLLTERDLATAEELLLQLQHGVTQPSEHRPDVDFATFFPAVVDHLGAGITSELVERARRREVDGPLDFTGLSPEMAETAASALAGWRAVSAGERKSPKTDGLVPAFRVLGLEFRTEKPAGLPGSNDRSWVDLTGVARVPQTLVPAFGTYAGESQRVLLVWKQPTESLLEWVEQDHSERPVIVLYFGTMSADVRRRVANRLRGRHRPVVIVDDAVLAWAASLGRQTFEVTMRATLPFSAVNPYQPGIAGAVPDEMFYGRVAERSAVMSDTGTSLIYGGRRLGKSALLRASERRFGSVPGQVALYIDLSAAGIRSTQRPEAVWDLIATRLVDVGVAERPSTKRAGPEPFTRTERAVRSYLAAADNRRLLLLLDECDDFFDTDAEGDFAQTRRLKDLMESTGRRFKVVFAGLHQVARFVSYPNQPLAHLGKPLAIGPLAPQNAQNLIAKPFTALGWRFASEDLINRVLTYCNYTPILLQEFGQTLISKLHERRVGPGEPPSLITAADIDSALSSGSLADAIRSRFDLTLSLDPRYKMIVYVLALETHAGGRATASAAMTTADLRDECRGWWSGGFAKVNDDEFRALLDELAGLGVLSLDRGAWRMRSPNVLRLLGTKQTIEAGLMELVRENPTPGGFFSSEAHRLVDLTAGANAGQRVRSPFTEQQLADVIGEGRNQLRVVVATTATGADRVEAVLGAVRGLTGRWELVVPPRPAVFDRVVVDVATRVHRVVFVDMRIAGDDAIRRSVAACAKHPSQPKATCAIVLVVAPGALPVVEDALAGLGVEDAAVMALRRYSPAGLRAWAVEVESGFTDDDARRQLADVTGGWPILIDEAEAAARATNARRAVAELDAGMASRSGWLLEVVGLAEAPLADAWATVAELLGPDGAEPPDTLGELVAEPPGEGQALLRALIAAGVLVTEGDKVRVEPVAAAAWRHVQAGALTQAPASAPAPASGQPADGDVT